MSVYCSIQDGAVLDFSSSFFRRNVIYLNLEKFNEITFIELVGMLSEIAVESHMIKDFKIEENFNLS